MFRDTIFALSSGTLPSAVAVVRLSGPHVREALERLSGILPEARRLVLTTIRTRNEEQIDRGFIVFFPSPASFTGEDCAEIQLHGSKAVIAALFREFLLIDGLRPAEAGEFARRAYLNGKFDLTGAEALADLIEAETEAQRRFAIANASGRQTAKYRGWRERLVYFRAMIESKLDFADEEDVPESIESSLWVEIAALRDEISEHIRGFETAEIIRDGYKVALVGPPNAGKSSVLNALARRDVAIVSDEPGTTRDLVVVELDLGGMKVVLTDTAGIREGAGDVERQGIEKARLAAESAQLVLRLRDLSQEPEGALSREYDNEIWVGTKTDLVAAGDLSDVARANEIDLSVSTLSGQGLEELLNRIRESAVSAMGGVPNAVPFRARHISELRAAEQALSELFESPGLDLELRAELLRRTGLALGKIIGDVDVEDVLDVIFSRFCIGK